MQVVYEKIAIMDEYVDDHCWIVTCDHHLDVAVWLIPRYRRPYRRYKQDLLMR